MAPHRQTAPGLQGPGRFTGGPLPASDLTPVITSVNPSSGRSNGGLAVTLTGANFRGNTNGSAPIVTFGGMVATSVVVVDQHTITCVTPVAADIGLVDIAVTCGTQTGYLLGSFTFFETTIVSAAPVFGPLAGGTIILLTGYNFELGSTVTFDGIPATNMIWIDAEHIRCTTPAHALGFVDIEVTGP